MSSTGGTVDRDRVLAALRELVEALDRRVTHLERLGEVREAAALRKEAARRIEELAAAHLDVQTREGDRSDAVMTDDGGPLPRK